MTFPWRTQFCLHRPVVLHTRRCTSVTAVASPPELHKEDNRMPVACSEAKRGDVEGKAPKWKKWDSEELGISTSMISKPTRMVLNRLRNKGHEVYLVGGCVRDLILKRIPKDFDIVTSAELNQVRKAFRQCEIVGKRFPICHVHVDDIVVEVSSFSTRVRKSSVKLKHDMKKPSGCSERDYIRWRNCLQRDFTINGLMFDLDAKTVYDYMGGMEDIRKSKLRTVTPANLSFLEDSARILRAIRIAARLRFNFSREIALSLKELSASVLNLDKGRILMELNYMFAYGSAEASLRVLWRFGLLEILLPIQASYLVSQGFRRRDGRSNMLLSLFSNLDRLVAPDRPCHPSLWIGIFAFHKALVDEPQDPSVIAAFSFAVHSGGSLAQSVKIAKRISRPYEVSFPELLEAEVLDSSYAFVSQVIKFAALVEAATCKMTDRHYISQAMLKYPQAPCSNLVFISAALSTRVSKIFECVRGGMEMGSVPKRWRKINYEALATGNLQEVRRTFARIVFDTVYPHRQKR